MIDTSRFDFKTQHGRQQNEDRVGAGLSRRRMSEAKFHCQLSNSWIDGSAADDTESC
jgi:hypothetical protein